MTQRSLADWLHFLEQLHPKAIDMDLERSREVARRLGLGRPAKRVITVTGTNGKGSTCAFLAELLREQGLTIGVYSSPHLLRYNERVQVNGAEASDEALCEAFAAVEAVRGEISLTYFEMGTLAAFWLFERAQLDAAVLEVGLGGRLDAVNLIDSDLALITNIGLEHTNWLGDTRERVAFEKAGILRSGKPALCGDLDPPQLLQQRIEELKAPFFLRGRDYDLALTNGGWHWRGLAAYGEPLALYDLPLFDLPMESAALALQAYALLGLPWDPAVLATALQRTRIIGRLDRRWLTWRDQPRQLLLDVGHNPHAARYLAQHLRANPPKGRLLAVFGLLMDKDLDGVLEPLIGLVQDWAVAPLLTPRSRPVTELESALILRQAIVSSHADIASALEDQCAKACVEDIILLFGSFHSVADGLVWLAEGADRRE